MWDFFIHHKQENPFVKLNKIFQLAFIIWKEKENSIKILMINVIYIFGGAHGVMIIVAGNGHGDTSSNPG